MKKILVLVCAAALVASCNNMNTQASSSAADSTIAAFRARDSVLARNKSVALASVEAWSTGNVDNIFKDFAPNAIDFGDGTGVPANGIDSIKGFAKSFIHAFPDTRGTNFIAIADGNHVAVFGSWTGTFKNAIMKVNPTQKSYKVNDVDLFTFNDAGSITEHRSVQSDATIMAQVGARMK